jgi:hypothetical protein
MYLFLLNTIGIDKFCHYLKIDLTQERVISQQGVSEQSGLIMRLPKAPIQKQKKKHRNNSYF